MFLMLKYYFFCILVVIENCILIIKEAKKVIIFLNKIRLYFSVVAVFFLVFSFGKLYSQSDEVNKNLRLYAHGKIDEVKNNLFDLLVDYPDDPGVKLLRAVVENDAEEALGMYQNILNNYSDSDWADYAYWRIIQYYAVTGNIEKAENELENFRLRYPTSVFLGTATDLIRTSQSIKNNGITKRQKTKDAPEEQSKNITAERISEEKVPDDADVITSNPKSEETSQDDNYDNSDNKDEIKRVTEDDESDESGFWGLQVGIYKNKDSAEKEREKFLTKRLRTKIEEKQVNGETMYAVVIGNYTSESSAEAAKKIVKQQCDCNPIIYKK